MSIKSTKFGEKEQTGAAETEMSVLTTISYLDNIIIAALGVQDGRTVETATALLETRVRRQCDITLEIAKTCLRGIEVKKDEKEVRRVDFGPMLEEGKTCLECLKFVRRGEEMKQAVEQFAKLLERAEQRCDACCRRAPGEPIAPKCAKKDRMYLDMVIAQLLRCIFLLG